LEFATIKGFKDILPEETGTWQRLESEARKQFHAYGFQEIMPPLLEMTELFSRSIGEDTDIVSRNVHPGGQQGPRLTLRPEATASLLSWPTLSTGCDEKNLIQKLFTIGPMFRHERPQKVSTASSIRLTQRSSEILAPSPTRKSFSWHGSLLGVWASQSLLQINSLRYLTAGNPFGMS
jgi:histidyl-tRNA synthetase